MPLIERLLKTIPFVRRPYFQRDAARAEASALREKLAGTLDALAPDVRRFFGNANHFLLPGDDERQERSVGEFRPYIRRAIAKENRALEIGPSLNPVLPKAEGYNVAVLDHTDQAGLIEKYTPYGVDTGKIEPVDFVWRGGSLAEAVKHARYEAIVACHVIEHAPDFVRFLTDCSGLLAPGGALYLLVPDKRYCFDFFQPLSDAAKVLGDHRAGRTRHSFESFYRNSAHVNNPHIIAWDQRGLVDPRFPHGDPKAIRDFAERCSAADAYEDVHENYFTPMSFMMLIDELRYLGEADLAVTLLSRARGCEFLAVLAKADAREERPEDFLARKLCAYRVLMIEEMERIQSIGAEVEKPGKSMR
jgi:SAM-dependent methyltransferase